MFNISKIKKKRQMDIVNTILLGFQDMDKENIKPTYIKLVICSGNSFLYIYI